MLIRFMIFFIVFSLIWGYFRKKSYRKTKMKFDARKEIPFLLFFLYLVGVFFVTFEPFRFHFPDSHPIVWHLKPFEQINEQFARNATIAWYYLIANIVMFVPLGFLLPIVLKTKMTFIKIGCFALCLSLAIEILQLLFTMRYADIDDVIFNTLGALIGFSCFIIFSSIGQRRLQVLR